MLNRKLRNCEGFCDENNPLPAPDTESEWHEMFSRIPVHDPKTVMMILKNRTMKVKPRVHNWLSWNCKYTDNEMTSPSDTYEMIQDWVQSFDSFFLA